jgi:predicted O-methyltransferase YrrM
MRFFLKYTVFNFLLFVKSLILCPFSKLARHRLSNTLLVLQYPFFGDRYVHLSEILENDDLEVSIAPVKARKHNTTSFELMAICALLKDNNCNNIFEIGTFDGRTTRAMALNLSSESGKILTLNLPPGIDDVLLHTSADDVDLAHKVISGERFINTPQGKLIEQLWGDSATFDFSPYYNSMDLVFIDGAHSEQYVKSDTEKALQLIKQSGGIIIWHDAHLFGVVKYLEPWIKSNQLPVYFIKDTSLATARIRNGSIVDFKIS